MALTAPATPDSSTAKNADPTCSTENEQSIKSKGHIKQIENIRFAPNPILRPPCSQPKATALRNSKNSQSPQLLQLRRSTRIKNVPGYLKDYVLQ